MSGRDSFSEYGKVFQESLAQLIFEDRAFSDQIGEVIDTSFFDIKYLEEFANKVYEYKRKYEVHPSTDIFETFLKIEFDEEDNLVFEQVKNFFQRTKIREINDIAYIKESSIKFCKNQKISQAILASLPLLKNGEYDQIEKIVREAVGFGLEDDDGHDFIADFELRYAEGFRPNLVPTGWEEINKIVGGGFAAGELVIFMASSGTGKSFFLAHYGASAIKQGKNVIHFTLELSKEIIGRRYDAVISTIPLDDLVLQKDIVWDRISDLPGQLEIVKYPRNKITVIGLANRIEKIIKKKFKPDLIIVDYGDLVKPVGQFANKVDALQDTFEAIQGLGEQFEVPIATATQTNRAGVKAEINELDGMAGAYAKSYCAQFVYSLSRRPQDIANNTGRGFVAKNNLGPNGIIHPLYFDTFTTTQIDILPEDSFENSETPSSKSQKEKLKDMWNNIQQGNR